MDLGRAANVKHHIILTDPIPFKERYRRIPPQLYELYEPFARNA